MKTAVYDFLIVPTSLWMRQRQTARRRAQSNWPADGILHNNCPNSRGFTTGFRRRFRLEIQKVPIIFEVGRSLKSAAEKFWRRHWSYGLLQPANACI